ncbi:uncharacterized protein B4U79_11429, partial [Dinothrombium tinctorium]
MAKINSTQFVYPFILVTFAAVSVFLIWRKLRMRKVGYIKKIIIYPIKSVTGIELNSAYCSKTGLQCNECSDRSFLLVDENNRFITLRKDSSLVLLKPTLHEDELWIQCGAHKPLKIKLSDDFKQNKIIETKVWDQPIKGYDCGDEVASWFQEVLDRPGYRLIKYSSEFPLRSSLVENGGKIKYARDRPIIFQDGSPYLIINSKSIKDLNSKLEECDRVSYRNFRPSILVESEEPFSEDNWKQLRIGDTSFQICKPCERCKVTTINPDTGEQSSEPLNTLRNYRAAENKIQKALYGTTPLFGVGFSLDTEGQISVAVSAFLIWRKLRMRKVGFVKKIIIYPIKSVTGVELKSAFCSKNCLEFNGCLDRSFLLVDEHNKFITLRKEPSLVLLKLSFHEDELWVQSEAHETLKIKLSDDFKQNKLVETKVWNQTIKAYDCGDEIASWFQKVLDRPGYRLIKYSPELPSRPTSIEKRGKIEYARDKAIIFHDGCQYHIVNTKSVEDLNSRLEESKRLSYRNFRPSILVEAEEPFAEDNWMKLKIGDASFEYCKPNERCRVTTVNPDTGEQSSEPLETLRKYRSATNKVQKSLYGTSPFFGTNLSLNVEGQISVGD